MTTPNLFLLPGLLTDARLWQYQISGLSDVVRTTVADLTGADSIAALAAMALSQAPAGRFALAGLSMGGYVALEIMRQAPERVSLLALLDTSARPDTAQATEARRNLMQLAETNFPAITDILLPRLVHPAHLKDTSIITTIRAMAETVGKQVFLRQERAIIGRTDSRPFLHQIQCPTLVLCGREDEITPISVHQELSGALPNSHLTIIEECGHLSTLEKPQQVTETLRKWLLNIEL